MMMWTRNTAQNLKPRGDVVNIADGSCADTEAGYRTGTSSRRADGNPEPDQAQTARGTTMMTDTPIVHINENSPEQIAYKLFLHIVAREDVELAPGQRAVVPTGVAIALPDGYAAFVHPRSGLAARHGVTLVNAPGTVDAGYRGEIRVTLLNTDASSPVRFQRGDRIAQLVVQRVERPVFHEVDTLPGSARGDGGFGSTGGHAATAGQVAGNEIPATG